MAKKQYVANEVNAEKVSETPTVLVEAAKKENELSPNPAGSGFVKQHFVDSLPESGNANELYIIPQKANGGIVGYKNYKYNVATKKWERVFGSDPLLKLTKGGQGTLAHNNNPERKAFAQIFNGNVAINGGKLYIDGKEAGQGGGGDSGNHPNVYEVESFENVSAEILEQLNVGDIVVESGGGGPVKKLGFVNKITNHLEILRLDGDIFNFYEYHKVDNEWSLDEHYQEVHQRVYVSYLNDIARLTYDEVDVLDLGDVVRTETETWVVSNFSEEDEDFAIYLCKTTDESIVFVRYVYNEDNDEYTFDTSYGVDGYLTWSLDGPKTINLEEFSLTIDTLTDEILNNISEGDVLIDFDAGDEFYWNCQSFTQDATYNYVTFSKLSESEVTFVRYKKLLEGDEWSFDTTYGTSGYNVISLGGGAKKHLYMLCDYTSTANGCINGCVHLPTDNDLDEYIGSVTTNIEKIRKAFNAEYPANQIFLASGTYFVANKITTLYAVNFTSNDSNSLFALKYVEHEMSVNGSSVDVTRSLGSSYLQKSYFNNGVLIKIY